MISYSDFSCLFSKCLIFYMGKRRCHRISYKLDLDALTTWQTVAIAKLQSSKEFVITRPGVDMPHRTYYGDATVSLDCPHICTCKMLNMNCCTSEDNPIIVICEVHVKYPQVVKKRIKINILSLEEDRSACTV